MYFNEVSIDGQTNISLSYFLFITCNSLLISSEDGLLLKYFILLLKFPPIKSKMNALSILNFKLSTKYFDPDNVLFDAHLPSIASSPS